MSHYDKAHKNLVIKILEELYFEEVFKFDTNEEEYFFRPCEGVEYKFKGIVGPFDNLQMDKSSLVKSIDNDHVKCNAFDLLKETQHLTKMTGVTLAYFIEECHQTLFCDAEYLKLLDKIDTSTLHQKRFCEVDSLLPGHPKIINNKGRLGWGASEMMNYAPELGGKFKLHWIAVKKDIAFFGHKDLNDHLYFAKQGLEDVSEISADFPEDYIPFPVHPWQWNRFVRIQYADLIDEGLIIDLGEIGQTYKPQTSIRTLSNMSDKLRDDIKLSISILNTSNVRGIRSKYIEKGYLLSEWFEEVVRKDNFLCEKVRIAKESVAISVAPRSLSGFSEGPDHLREELGCITRSSVESLLNKGENAYSTATLFFEANNDCFFKGLLQESGLDIKSWLREYTKVVILGLYHLQIHHGIGVVAHGQNTVLVTENGIPKSMILKDFHGDLRLSDNSGHVADERIEQLNKLPSRFIIHDFLTGQFVTVLRFFSRVLKDHGIISEEEFYKTIFDEVKDYCLEHKALIDSLGPHMNILRPTFEKLVVNRVRFDMGYGELGDCPEPILGTEITNPIVTYADWRIHE